jgi:hypothetical protein
MKVRNVTLLLVLMVGIFSGCAVMNTSMMETAETTRPGHPKFGVEYGYGLDLTSTMLITSVESSTFDATTLLSLPVYGMKVGIGLTDDTDINGKLWVSLGGIGFKGYLKHRLPLDSEKASIAIAPGLTFVTTESDEKEEDSVIDIADIKSYGFEIPFLATYRVGEALAFTGMVRYSADFISIEQPGIELEDIGIDEAFMLNRFGVIGGLSLEFGPLYLRPEIGVEMATPKNGTFGAAPIFAIGAGFDL